VPPGEGPQHHSAFTLPALNPVVRPACLPDERSRIGTAI
jgi:hypothetical protein